MSDRRRHRGPHPTDAELFAPAVWPVLRTAAEELCWLLDRGYAVDSSLKLVGDRHELRARQRLAVRRSVCTTQQLAHRLRKRVACSPDDTLWVDGFNLLTTIEAALSGGVTLVGREGCCRDLASMHGTYRRVEETSEALQRIAAWGNARGAGRLHWLLDEPVSNSGRLAGFIRDLAARNGWRWEAELVRNPDADLIALPSGTVVSADSVVLDGCRQWCNLAAEIVSELSSAWVVPIGSGPARAESRG